MTVDTLISRIADADRILRDAATGAKSVGSEYGSSGDDQARAIAKLLAEAQVKLNTAAGMASVLKRSADLNDKFKNHKVSPINSKHRGDVDARGTSPVTNKHRNDIGSRSGTPGWSTGKVAS